MKRPLANLIIAGSFTLQALRHLSLAVRRARKAQYKRSATITRFAATDIAIRAADAGLRAATATQVLALTPRGSGSGGVER